jgi:hypothetical protein
MFRYAQVTSRGHIFPMIVAVQTAIAAELVETVASPQPSQSGLPRTWLLREPKRSHCTARIPFTSVEKLLHLLSTSPVGQGYVGGLGPELVGARNLPAASHARDRSGAQTLTEGAIMIFKYRYAGRSKSNRLVRAPQQAFLDGTRRITETAMGIVSF